MKYRAIAAALLFTALALPLAADWRQTPQTITWYRTAPEGSPADGVMADFVPALIWHRDRQGNPLLAGLLTSARVQVVTADGVTEISITWPRAPGEAWIEEWAPRCGWEEGGDPTRLQVLDRCLAAQVRDMVRRYRDATREPLPETPPIGDDEGESSIR